MEEDHGTDYCPDHHVDCMRRWVPEEVDHDNCPVVVVGTHCTKGVVHTNDPAVVGVHTRNHTVEVVRTVDGESFDAVVVAVGVLPSKNAHKDICRGPF